MSSAILFAVMDDLDRSLITELEKNAWQTSVELSRKLGIRETTARRRVRHLVEQGIIRVVAIPDAAELGYRIAALVALEVELPSVDSVAESLAACPNVLHVITCTGRFDIVCWVQFHSSAEMEEFIKNHLAKIQGIRKSETHIILNVKSNIMSCLQPPDSKSGSEVAKAT